ncbi:MAG: hypothetical protein LBK47_10720 [Prevotellaceae bacterium]|jgi:hypothetical protein|nr:hypothetical protein [Prevotellaceae bacterium]
MNVGNEMTFGGARCLLLLVAVGCGLCCAATALPPPHVGDMGYLSRSEAWLGSENAAGLQSLPDSLRLSTVEAYLHKGNGTFVNYHESDNSTEAGAVTESYYRLNPRVVFYGKVHYGYFTGRNMGGSAWIDPYDTPFDLVETVDTTRGVKNLERYRLAGALSVNVWQGLSLGGRIDYQAANYAKTRDLRHTNKYSDLAFSVGARYAFGSIAEAGLNYFYRYSAEDIVFETYGTTDRQYTSLVSFGGFFGRTERYDNVGTGYTIDANPLFNAWQGAAAQAALRLTAHWKLFVEASGKWRSGYFGKRGTTSTVFTEHEGDDYALSGTLSYRRNAAQHLLKAAFRQVQLKNFENIHRKENTLGGRTEIVYYGQNIVRDADRMQAELTYSGYFGVEGYRPVWRVEAGAEYARMAQTVSQYPYYRRQRLYGYAFFLHAGRTAEWQANEVGLLLGAACGKGGGDPKDDGLYSLPSSTQKPPGNFDNYLYHEFDYLTAPRMGGCAEATYARRFHPRLRASVSLRYELTRALQQPVSYLGNSFHFVTLSVGATF